ncbi:MAG: AzlD domain-containing protein [Chloroflexota bacterium]
MTVDPLVLVTIILMAVVTYATRLGGFLLLSRLNMTGKMAAWLHYVPGAVLISIIAPTAVPNALLAGSRGESGALTAGPAEALSAIVAIAVAARTKNLLLTMAAGVVAVWVFRRLLGS